MVCNQMRDVLGTVYKGSYKGHLQHCWINCFNVQKGHFEGSLGLSSRDRPRVIPIGRVILEILLSRGCVELPMGPTRF